LDGSLNENIWNSQAHGEPGSTSQFAQLLVQNDQITLTLYHAAGYTIHWGLFTQPSQDATVTWTFARTKDGGVGNVLQYHVAQGDTSYSADWESPALYHNYGYYSDGWLEYYPHEYSIPVPSPLDQGLMPHVNQVAVFAHTGITLIGLPAGLTESHQTLNGHPADTFWDSTHTSSITFVYQGQAKQTLIAQIYRTYVDCKWVTTTDHSNAFISQTATYDKRGGSLESSSTTFTAANGQTATLNGTWTSGTAVDNATGFETGDNYLGFGSVTIQVQNGKAVERYGLLGEDQGENYAMDTFNSSGTKVIKREVSKSSSKTSPVVQTWTGTHNNLTVVWNKPNADTINDTFVYQWDAPHGYSGYNLMRFNALFKKPLDFTFDHYDVTTRSYNWSQFVSHSPSNGWTWNYRESGDSGSEYNAKAYLRTDNASFSPDGVSSATASRR
jgi:hypothetical protein